MNIIEKMAAITAELQTVAKNLTVETGRNKSYKAVSERDIIDAVKPLESKYGVYSYPAGRRVLESEMLESESEYNGKITKKTTFFSRIETLYRFVNVEDPTDYIETVTFAEGIDSQDKGSGKAMTYGDKYALMKAYKISTGDDPDQSASVDTQYTRAKPTERCSACGSEITSIRKKDGDIWQASDIINYSMLRFGKVLCPECQRAAIKHEREAEKNGH